MIDAQTDPAARPYHHGDLRRALVEAGLAILEEEGLAALSLRAIAARAGVSHAAPRNHFPSLRALHTAIAAEGFRLHAASMRDGVGPHADREARLKAALTGYVAFAARHPALFAFMFSPHYADFADAELAEAGRASYAVLAEISQGLLWPGAEGPDRQRRTEAMLWSFVHGYATLAQAGLLRGTVGLGGDPSTAEAVLSVTPAFSYEG